jgi:hypothetical protein
MSQDHQSPSGRRTFLAGLGTVAVGAVAANVVGPATSVAAQAPGSAVVPSVCVFDVN